MWRVPNRRIMTLEQAAGGRVGVDPVCNAERSPDVQEHCNPGVKWVWSSPEQQGSLRALVVVDS